MKAVLLSHMLRIKRSNMNFWVILLLTSWVSWATATVTYDQKSLIIDGQRRILISGSIHYPRSTPQMWPDLIQKAKDGGLDVIQTYVFWDGHEPSKGTYNFEGRFDLVGFIKVVQKAGLYVHLRIGPYVCAEWNFGGFPVWLKYVPGIAFRTDNEPFKAAMQKFTEKIVGMMKAEKLFEPQGGPIILSQIENEYDTVEGGLGAAGKAYVNWAAKMALNLQTGVPWVMCKGQDAPDPVINTCNAFYCQGFVPNSTQKPKFWTEAWSGWFTAFGKPVPYRPVQDLAYAIARFIQAGGSFVNYYMYHGGTNFGRTAGGPFIATSYDYDAPIDEYGLLRQPKWGHLKDLHEAIKQSEPALVSGDPQVKALGSNQEAHVFQSKSGCAAFLANYDPKYSVKVTFRNIVYDLPPWSVSILPDCVKETFNTARVNAQSIQMKMNPVNVGRLSWQSSSEGIPFALDSDVVPMGGLWEQINVTRDTSDYLWYLTTVDVRPGDLKGGQDPTLTVMSAGHVLHVFINGHFSGTAYGGVDNPKLTFQQSVHLSVGTNKISLLSVAMGLPNVGFRYETWNVGILGPVTLAGMNGGTRDLVKQKWSYKVGLKGESLSLYSPTVGWLQGSSLAQNQPLTWYKTSFNTPRGNDPLALDMSTMTKGQIWINGIDIGRYWPAYTAAGRPCTDNCNYAGTYDENKCLSDCGNPSQRWYHIPRSWLNRTPNSLVVLEELGGKPTGITVVTRTA